MNGEERGQLSCVLNPSAAVAGALLFGGQVGVAQPEQRALAVWYQRDLDRRRPWRHLRTALPAPREHDPVGWLDRDESTGRMMHTVDIESKDSTWPGVELGADAHPLDESRRVGQVGEDGRGLRVDPLLDLYRFDLFLSSASASKRSLSIFCAHILRRYASSGLSAARSAR